MNSMIKLFRNLIAKANTININSKNQVPPARKEWYCHPETNLILELFEENNIEYEIIKDNVECIIYKFEYKVENGTLKCFLERRRKENQIHFYIYVLEQVSAVKFEDISVFCTIINCEFSLGNFELDNDENILRFRTSYIYDESASSFKNIVFNNINYSLHAVDSCLPHIMTFEYSKTNTIGSFKEQISGLDIHLN